MKKVYVATSWRNEHQPEVVRALRAEGFAVYDFRHPAEGDNGFSWREIDGDWLTWTPAQYLQALKHPASERGFTFDMDALRGCDLCVMVMPCGMSASLEAGYAVGAGKPTAVYVPGLREPDLMVKMAGLVTSGIHELRAWLRQQASERTTDAVIAVRSSSERSTADLRAEESDALADPILAAAPAPQDPPAPLSAFDPTLTTEQAFARDEAELAAAPVRYHSVIDHYREMARRFAESRDELKHRCRALEAQLGAGASGIPPPAPENAEE